MARPTEIKAVAALLMEPADDINELAKAIIAAVDESRMDRTDWMVCAKMGTLVYAYGPYPTRNRAEQAIESRKIPAIDGTTFHVLAYRHPKAAQEAIDKADASPISDDARRIWEIARNGGQPAKTQSRRNRRR